MPLYQLFCISTPYAQFAPIRNLITSSASFVRQQGGLVRTVNFRGRKTLVQPMKKFGSNKRTENAGDIWTMHFDANPPTLQRLGNMLRADPRVLRHTTFKIGTTLEQVTQINPFGLGIGEEKSVTYRPAEEKAKEEKLPFYNQ